MKLRENIKRILREETNKDLTSVIERVLTKLFVNEHKDVVCKVEVIHPRENTQLLRPGQYSVIIYFIGVEYKFLPKLNLRDELMDEAWNLVYDYTGQAVSLLSDYVTICK